MEIIKSAILFIITVVIANITLELDFLNLLICVRRCTQQKEEGTGGTFQAFRSRIQNERESLKYAIYGKSSSETHLKHVHSVLQRIGYKRVPLEEEWDLLWAHDFPFRTLRSKIINLKDNQKINHFPGTGFLTHKVDLATTNLKYIPKAFRLPKDKDEFLKYSKLNPNVEFVEKNNEHRNITIKAINEINLNSNNTFIQTFIRNPYLVDGYKFDIGVYVIITSVNPLRIYTYKGDVLFRYCSEKYYPFNKGNLNKYVVGDDYLPTWQIPSLKHFYVDLKFSMKDSFDAYVQDHENKDPNIIWDAVDDAIRLGILAKEKDIVRIIKNYGVSYNNPSRNFFELMRFDLIIDEELNVHLVEANMSPNLSSAHFKPNALLYEQVIYNLMSLVNRGMPKGSMSKLGIDDEQEMLSSYKNLVVESEMCSTTPCLSSCSPKQCRVCFPCLSKNDLEILHYAYREHINRANNRRIFPPPIANLKNFDINAAVQNMNSPNELMIRWFYGKCKMDSSWCY